ncbi:hypothetical protein LP422_13210 [Janibacter limosus]|uniref:Uncharacterized protein n=1 Tax=Janibacter limosus TaxID=53458 RepID=A0AC61U1C6_9MICO|nr:hypothetical protein [Janibacter limosus]UUZ43761.1 hypothetical protein LP422_13210 [Janibacter limosus]
MTTEPAPGRARRSRPRLARDTIVGWMVLVLFVSLLSVVIVVRESLHLSVTERANAAVAQEIEEFRTFTPGGRRPRDLQALHLGGAAAAGLPVAAEPEQRRGDRRVRRQGGRRDDLPWTRRALAGGVRPHP